MNKQEMLNTIDNIRRELNDKLDQVAKQVSSARIKLPPYVIDYEQDYWFVQPSGTIEVRKHHELNYNDIHDITPVFPSLEKVKAFLKHCEIGASIADFAAQYNGDWKPDWTSYNQRKHFISYHHDVNQIVLSYYVVNKSNGGPYFKDKNFIGPLESFIGEDFLKKWASYEPIFYRLRKDPDKIRYPLKISC